MICLVPEARVHAHQVPPRTAERPGRWRPRMDVKQLVVADLGVDARARLSSFMCGRCEPTFTGTGDQVVGVIAVSILTACLAFPPNGFNIVPPA